MPPGKKAEQKRKEKIIEDKTFGLKNKNRSAKVQAYVQQVQKNVNERKPTDRKAAADAEERRRAKEEKKAREAELAKLFNDIGQQQRKKEEGESGEGGNADSEDEGGAFVYDPDAYLFRPEDFDEVEHDARRLEERLEAEREALQGRTDLTPVTEETFQAWKRAKRQEASAKEAARVRQAKAGQGALRGWDLWQMDQKLFVDDDQADEFYEREVFEDGEGEEYDLS